MRPLASSDPAAKPMSTRVPRMPRRNTPLTARILGSSSGRPRRRSVADPRTDRPLRLRSRQPASRGRQRHRFLSTSHSSTHDLPRGRPRSTSDMRARGERNKSMTGSSFQSPSGCYEEAIDATIDALTRCNEFERAESIRTVWNSGGNKRVPERYLQDLSARRRRSYTSPFLLAVMYARLERPDEMFHWLEVALRERSSRLCELRTNAWFRHYRSMGRFRCVERRIGY